MVGDLPEITKFPPIFQFFSKTFEQSGDLFDFLPKVLTFRYWLKIIYLFKDLNSSASRNLKHFGNSKNENFNFGFWSNFGKSRKKNRKINLF